jgi:hypothetical protein
MGYRTFEDTDIALQALQHVACYDAMRLKTYRQKENLADRIRVSPLGSAIALRFDDVGYFNRVYCEDTTVFGKLPEIEQFYRGGPFGCELVGPPASSAERCSISRPGWAPANTYAWMQTPRLRSLPPAQPGKFAIRPPAPSQRQEFLTTYLRAFDAQQDRFPAALRNMAHLFDIPELVFLMAWYDEKLAGVAMMMQHGTTALLCAGAALPEFREMGCHAALLAARIRLASESGCEQIYSWAMLGGQSLANLEKAGLSVVGLTTTWRYSPQPSA